MTTKPPSRVRPQSEKNLETIAYASVAGIPTVDPHDRDRLGYNVWRFLTLRRDPLEIAIRTAGARMEISEEEAVQRVRQSLRDQGVTL